MAHLIKYLLAALVLIYPIALLAESQQPGPLASKLAGINSLRAVFTQQTQDEEDREINRSTGELWLSGSGKFRIETAAPFKQVLVSDGINFWTYDEDLQQVVIRPLQADIRRMPVLLFGGNPEQLNQQYNISALEDNSSLEDNSALEDNSSIEDNKEQTFVLQPRSNDALFDLLTLAFAGEAPSRVMVRDSFGQTTHILFSEVVINSELAPSVFLFQNPPGVDVIDDR